jgi:hypothetical protein
LKIHTQGRAEEGVAEEVFTNGNFERMARARRRLDAVRPTAHHVRREPTLCRLTAA